MENKKKWYQKTPGIIALLILFFPVGLFLMWKYSAWKPKTRWIITAVFAGLVFITSQAGNNKTLSDKQLATQPTQTTAPAQEQSISDAEQLPSSLPTIQPSKLNSQQVKVTQVIDGDTIQIVIDNKNETIRLIGIDTPETVDPRKPVQCFGKEASAKAKSLLSGKSVRLEADSTQGERDKYQRLLRYVFLEDGTNFNKLMISEGYAYEYTYNTPYKFQSEFKQAQKEAEANKKGLWADNVCPTTTSQPVPTNTSTSGGSSATTGTSGSSGGFTCAGKTTCGQMASCAEAQFYLNSCGVSRLDGDKDGVPCESLCN